MSVLPPLPGLIIPVLLPRLTPWATFFRTAGAEFSFGVRVKLFSQKAHRGFVPLSYQPENNDIPVHTPPTSFDALRTIAVSRIYLDNFDHITAYWVGNHYLFQRTSALVSPPTSAGCPASRENPNQKIPRGFPRALKPRQR